MIFLCAVTEDMVGDLGHTMIRFLVNKWSYSVLRRDARAQTAVAAVRTRAIFW